MFDAREGELQVASEQLTQKQHSVDEYMAEAA